MKEVLLKNLIIAWRCSVGLFTHMKQHIRFVKPCNKTSVVFKFICRRFQEMYLNSLLLFSKKVYRLNKPWKFFAECRGFINKIYFYYKMTRFKYQIHLFFKLQEIKKQQRVNMLFNKGRIRLVPSDSARVLQCGSGPSSSFLADKPDIDTLLFLCNTLRNQPCFSLPRKSINEKRK